MKRRRGRLLIAAAVAIAGGVAVSRAAQEPDVPVFRGGVSAVVVDVSVEDRQERPMDGLGVADFELREDGVVQAITSAQLVRRDGRRHSNLDEALTIRSREHAESEAARDDVRVFALFLDDYHVEKDPQVTMRLRDALQQFVKAFGPNDLLTVMDPLTPLSALRYTRDLDEVQARIRAFEGRRGQLFPVRSVMEEAQLQSSNVWQIRATVTLSALEALVAHLGGLGEGRKSVLFVSQGPPASSLYQENEARLQGIIQGANRGNVTVHAFDPRPHGSSQPGGAYVLSRLAGETGGRAVANSNAPLPHLKQTLADASAYYLLGYTPSRPADDGRFHKIEVKVLRPGARVTARRGYWAPSLAERAPVPTPRPEPRQATALARLTTSVPGRVAEVWLGSARAYDAGRTAVTLAWEAAEGRRPGQVPQTLEVSVFDGGPRPAGAPLRQVEPARVLGAGASERFTLVAGQPLIWRFTVRGPDSVLDQWDQKMAVPELRKDRVVFATPTVYRARTAQQARDLQRGTGLAPTASRRFRPADRVRVDAESYAEAGAPDVTAEVLGSGGKRLVTLPVTAGPNGAVQVGLPVASLGQGIYVLRLHAVAGEHTAEERMAFEVIP
ncbi:MAG: VWA domain-containing protein [Vicinamibacterales bacterium]